MYPRYRIDLFIREIGSWLAETKVLFDEFVLFSLLGYPSSSKSYFFDLLRVPTIPHERLNRSYGVGCAQADRNKNTEKY
jgi:hypothetical protein